MTGKELGQQSIAPHRVDHDPVTSHFTGGLTKREHFAGLAMQGLLTTSGFSSQISLRVCSRLAEQAVKQADALLEELAKE